MQLRGANAKRTRPGRRHGAALSVSLLLALPVLLTLLFFVVNAALIAEARTQMHKTADAAALAAVQCLVDDSWLIGDPNLQLNLIGVAQAQAQYYAGQNRIVGQPLTLQLPASATSNPPNGDLFFAFLDQPRDPNPANRVLVVNDLNGAYNNLPFLSQVNTVRVNARRQDSRNTGIPLLGGKLTSFLTINLEIPATATLDRDVIGFQPMGDQPLPLVPIGLLTRAAPGSPVSWDNELALGNDNFAFNPSTNTFSVGSDRLPEVTLTLTADPTQTSAALLLFGLSDLTQASQQAAFVGQAATGPYAADLSAFGGNLVLNTANNLLSVPATTVADTSFYAALAGQLNQTQGQKRVWPLYESFDGDSGQAVLAGFVAARLVLATANGAGLTLVLQPCMMSTRTAVTSALQRGVGGINITNPYICKVRIVE